MKRMIMMLLLLVLLPAPLWAHTGTLDLYGCHSNKALFGTTAKRECHADLLSGQVFTSTTAEYKAYIAAQKLQLSQLQSELATAKTQLTTAQQLLGSVQADLDKFKASYLGAFTLTWNANTETDLAGYRVYCGGQPGQYTRTVQLGKITTYRLTELKAGAHYCAVTAYNIANQESAFSSEVSKEIP